MTTKPQWIAYSKEFGVGEVEESYDSASVGYGYAIRKFSGYDWNGILWPKPEWDVVTKPIDIHSPCLIEYRNNLTDQLIQVEVHSVKKLLTYL